MKMLHVNLVYLPAYRYGGPIFSVHNQNKGIAKEGVDVTVYTTTIDGKGELDVPVGVPVEIAGVHVYYFPPTPFMRKWFYSYAFHRFLATHIHEFDLIHVTSVFTAASVLVHYYARKHKKPYVMSPRGSLMREPLAMKRMLFKKFYLRLIENRTLRDAVAIHFTTEQEREEYIEGGFPMKRGFVIPNGLDPTEYSDVPSPGTLRRKYGIPEDKKIILFLSRINWKKGFDTLIPAFAKVKREFRDAALLIVGGDDEGYGRKVRSFMARENLKEGRDVIFAGMLIGDHKVAAFQESSLFVLSSYSENFGVAVVEAMLFGLPVVVTNGVGISTAISHAQAGIVTRKDVDEVTQAMLSILRDEEQGKRMGENGRKLVREEFQMESVARRFVEEYGRAIEENAAWVV